MIIRYSGNFVIVIKKRVFRWNFTRNTGSIRIEFYKLFGFRVVAKSEVPEAEKATHEARGNYDKMNLEPYCGEM